MLIIFNCEHSLIIFFLGRNMSKLLAFLLVLLALSLTIIRIIFIAIHSCP